MVAEVCRGYGWGFNDVLSMPAVSFFTMLRAIRSLELMRRLDDCMIQSISIANSEWYDVVRSRFQDQLDLVNGFEKSAPPANIKKGPPVLDSGSEEAKAAMFKLFRGVKRR